MSRVGKKAIAIPEGVTLETAGRTVTVKGPKGTLAMVLAPGIGLARNDDTATVQVEEGNPDERKAIHGTMRANIANMVTGVSAGFRKVLEITGTGYRATMDGKKLVLQVGYSHPVVIDPPAGITLAIESPTRMVVSGIDRAQVGQVAAEIREKRPPEPYKGKGIRYEGEIIRRKAGKSAGA